MGSQWGFSGFRFLIEFVTTGRLRINTRSLATTDSLGCQSKCQASLLPKKGNSGFTLCLLRDSGPPPCSPAPWPPQWPPLLSSDSSMLLPGFYFCFSLYLKCSFQDIYITPSSIFIRFLLKCQIISKAFPDHPSPPLCCHKPLFSCSHGCLSSYVCLYLCLSSPYSIVSSVRTLGSLLQHLEQCLTHRLNSTSIGSWRT